MVSSPATVESANVTRGQTPATDPEGDDRVNGGGNGNAAEEQLPEKLRFLLAQSTIYSSIIADKLNRETADRRKRDAAVRKRAAAKQERTATRQANAGRTTRRGDADEKAGPTGTGATGTGAVKSKAAASRRKPEPAMLSSEDDDSDAERDAKVKSHDFEATSKVNTARNGGTPVSKRNASKSNGSASRGTPNGSAKSSSRLLRAGKRSAGPTKPRSRSNSRVTSSSGSESEGHEVRAGSARSETEAEPASAKKQGKPKAGVKVEDANAASDSEQEQGQEQEPEANAEGEDKGMQPSLVTGAKMKSYQIAGMEWLISLYENGLNGILADEMGLGKTLQTISLLAYLRERGVWGPFLVCCPLSTLANWVNEFERFTPDIPVVLYHGTPQERAEIRAERLTPPTNEKINVANGESKSKTKNKKSTSSRFQNTTETFPVVVTSYELVINDRKFLANYQWKYLIIDESHRIKNLNCKLIKELMSYKSANRLLLTGTPLQNNLEELWSLLNFLMPEIFDDLDSFKSWFDIDVTSENTASHQIVTKLHAILKPFLLRRVKREVEKGLPPKKEYLLSAPLTVEQKSLYDAVLKRQIRDFLLAKKEILPESETPAFTDEEPERDESAAEEDVPAAAAAGTSSEDEEDEEEDEKEDSPEPVTRSGRKRKAAPSREEPAPKRATRGSAKGKAASIAQSSPAPTPTRAAAKRARPSTYKDETERDFIRSLNDGSAHDKSAHFEKKRFGNNITMEGFGKITGVESSDEDMTEEERRAGKLAKNQTKKIHRLKLSNMVMQLRKVVNHPWLFDWPVDPKTGEHILDDRIIASSGKMMLLERLLDELFATGHKVLVFSQFTTQLDIIEDWAVDWKGWNICRIDGHTKQEDRRSQLKDFNENKGKDAPNLFLLSTRSGGVGINLTGADTVILFDSDWNPQMDLQAMDRVHRLGQTKPVLVFRLITANTIEAKMIERAGNKRKLEALVIGQGKYTTSLDDLQDIFSGKAAAGDKGKAKSERVGGIAASMFADEMRDQNARDQEQGSKEIRVIQSADEVISDEQLRKLLDRSDDAMLRSRGWREEVAEVIETAEAESQDDDEEQVPDAIGELFRNEQSVVGTPKTENEDDD